MIENFTIIGEIWISYGNLDYLLNDNTDGQNAT